MMSLGSNSRFTLRGFTLLELVLAMTLLALVMSLLFSGLRLANRSWESGIAHVETANQIHLVQGWIRRYLTQARPILLPSDERLTTIAFSGEPHMLRFVAPLPAHRGGGGLYVVTIEASKERAEKRLLLRYQLFHPDLGGFFPTEEGKQVVLLDSIKDLEFSYFGSPSPRESPQWYEGSVFRCGKVRLA